MKTTKELARELGLLRKRSSSSTSLNRIKKTCQLFSYLIVIDFESTCWQDGKHRSQEIIEFPAVLLNTSTGEIESQFQYYIQPQEHPILSDFCKQLTGISQDQVEQGIPLSVCLRKFSQWLKQISEERKFVYNTSDDPTQKKCTFVTWSDWDLSVCLQYEVQRKQLRKPQELNSWLDLRATYRKFYDRRPNGLNGALQDLGINFEGREHSGLDDAKNTAKLAYRMMCDGCVMIITKSLTPAFASAVGNPVGVNHSRNTVLRPPTQNVIQAAFKSSVSNVNDKAALTNSNLTVPKSIQTTNQHEEENSTFSKVMKTTTSVCKSSPQVNFTNIKAIGSGNGKGCSSVANTKIHVGSSRNNVLRPNNTTNCQSRKFDVYQDKNSSSSSITKPVQSNVAGTKLSTFTFRDVTNTSQHQKTSFSGNYKTPSPTLKTTPTNCNKTPSSRPCVFSSNSMSRTFSTSTNSTSCVSDQKSKIGNVQNKFKTPSPVTVQHNQNNTSNNRSGSALSWSYKTPSPVNNAVPNHNSCNKTGSALSWSYKTPSPIFNTSTNKSFTNSSTYMKKTPPLCQCGRRTTRKFVQSPGPNEGRPFYCCPVGRGGNSSGVGLRKNSGCGYFLWESKYTSPQQLQLNQNSLIGNRNVNSTSSLRGNGSINVKSPSESNNSSGFSVTGFLKQPNFDTPDGSRVQSVINPPFKK